MELIKELPQFDDLDLEFSKCRLIFYDILTNNINRRINLGETLRDDLYEWLALKLKNKIIGLS